MKHEVLLRPAAIAWAIEAAFDSLGRWKGKSGYYNNRFNSHFKGRLGELAVEAIIEKEGLHYTAHFRFPDREKLCDIEIHDSESSPGIRIEAKTWSSEHWDSLGRCVSVAQFKYLKEKADRIVWCVVSKLPSLKPERLKDLDAIPVTAMGWSSIDEVQEAPIHHTGHDWMRKVENHQLDEDSLNSMNSFL